MNRLLWNVRIFSLILAVLVLVTCLGLSTALGSNVALAHELITLGPECGVLTVETPTQPEVAPFPPGIGDPVNHHPDRDETDRPNRVERPIGEDSAPPCPQLDVLKSKVA